MVLFEFGCLGISFDFTPTSLSPLIPLSNQQDGTSPADKYIGEGEFLKRGAPPLLDALYKYRGWRSYRYALPCRGGGDILRDKPLIILGGRVGKDITKGKGAGVRQNHQPNTNKNHKIDFYSHMCLN